MKKENIIDLNKEIQRVLLDENILSKRFENYPIYNRDNDELGLYQPDYMPNITTHPYGPSARQVIFISINDNLISYTGYCIEFFIQYKTLFLSSEEDDTCFKLKSKLFNNGNVDITNLIEEAESILLFL